MYVIPTQTHAGNQEHLRASRMRTYVATYTANAPILGIKARVSARATNFHPAPTYRIGPLWPLVVFWFPEILFY